VKAIALNGRFTGTRQPTGTQTAAFHLFDQILRANRTFRLVVFADPRFGAVAEWKTLPGVEFVEVPFQSWSRGRAQLWEQFRFCALARRHGCDAAHHPINTSPAFGRCGPTVVTLHDLNFLCHPDWYSFRFRTIYTLCALPGLRRAARVVTISQYVLGQARETLRLPEERLRMIYNGVRTLEASAPVSGSRYVVCVGSLPPHKNLARLIRGFQEVRKNDPGLELHVVGRPVAQHGPDPSLGALLESEGVRVLGYLSDAELAAAYAGAAVFCYLSLEEGFGLPLLEAMTLGCPVVTSNVSCLPEIAGPAAELVDPYSVEAIADGLRRVLTWDSAERARRIEAGRERAARFSWRTAAERYLEVYAELLSEKPCAS
jgi:glycosyltransferase involved in cell wall biosynthesis